MQYYCPASVRIRSRGAFRNPSLYAEKTESRSNSCKGFFAEHLSELMLAFSSHLSNSSGLYPYISAYLRFFINFVIIKKAGRALKVASPGQARQSSSGGNTARRILPFPGCHVMYATALKTYFIPPALLICSTRPFCRHGERRLQDVAVLARSQAHQRYRYETNLLPYVGSCAADLDRRRRGPAHKDAVLMLRACDNLPHSCAD